MSGVSENPRLIQDLFDRTHIRFDSLSGNRSSRQEQSAGEGGTFKVCKVGNGS